MTNRRDPLERAFELLKADPTGLACDSTLETKLMTQLERQNRPRNWLKRVALVAAVVVGLVLAGGGIALAAGYDPIRLFVTFDADGNGVVLDENGNPTDAQVTFVPTGNGEVEATVTVTQPGTYQVTVTPPGDGASKK